MGLFPIEVNGNTIIVPGMSLEEGYTRFRRAILDGEVPVTMPIGFCLNTPKNTSYTTAIDRNASCQESMVSIASNVSGLVLVGDMDSVVDTEEAQGILTTGNALWRSKGKNACHPINRDRHLLTAVEPMSLQLFVHKAAGYHSMEENAARMGSSLYFPLNTCHSLVDYVSVLPLMGDSIQVRYRQGMTAEQFQEIWNS